MLRVFLLTLIASAASAEFLDVRIGFEDGGCITCVESLRGRLERVRGVDSVEIDLEQGQIRLSLARGNKVRLGPLQSRVRQGGTKVTSVWVRARGSILSEESETFFRPAGLTRKYPLDAEAPGTGEYEIEGTVKLADSSAAPRIRLESTEPVER